MARRIATHTAAANALCRIGMSATARRHLIGKRLPHRRRTATATPQGSRPHLLPRDRCVAHCQQPHPFLDDLNVTTTHDDLSHPAGSAVPEPEADTSNSGDPRTGTELGAQAADMRVDSAAESR